MRGLFRRAINLLTRSQPGRWALSGILLAFGLICLLGSFASTGNNALSLLVGGILFLAFGLFALIFTILIARRTKTEKQSGEALAKQLLAEGKLLPIPTVPIPPKSVPAEDQMRIEGYANQLNSIPWGAQARIPSNQVEPVFNQTVATTRRITGDWARLREPIQTFAALPQPYCHVGAAEAMFRLSFLSGMYYHAPGLRQGLRFASRAQLHTPLQPDALMIQVKLLAACKVPSWQKLATQAVELARNVAPNHPRLANSMLFYHRMRGEHDEALQWADRAIASGPTPEESYAALSTKAVILMEMKRYDEALAAYDACLQQDPRDPWAWHNKSVLLTSMGQYQQALACNQQALSIMDFATARKQREMILAHLGAGEAAD